MNGTLLLLLHVSPIVANLFVLLSHKLVFVSILHLAFILIYWCCILIVSVTNRFVRSDGNSSCTIVEPEVNWIDYGIMYFKPGKIMNEIRDGAQFTLWQWPTLLPT